MLQQLEIHNIALIEKVSVEMGEGLNVLTGETGAGKSILIDSIYAILGERLSKDLIRTGKEKALVEAVFQIDNERFSDLFEDMGIPSEEDGTLILSREFTAAGKNICRINGKMVTVSALKEIGERLIDIHGQHDNQSLLKTESHIELLDSFGGDAIPRLKSEYGRLLAEYRSIREKIKSLSGDGKERERRIDLLKYQIDEIKKAKLKPGEEEDLDGQRALLANSEKIMSTLSSAYAFLFSGQGAKNAAADMIARAVKELGELERFGEKYQGAAKKLEEISYQLEDIIDELRKERDRVEYNPDRLEQIDDRLDLIHRLKRKYGGTVGEVLEYCKTAGRELDEIVKSEETAALLCGRLEALNESLYSLAADMHRERQKAAETLEGRIGNELADLEMKNARFKVQMAYDGTGPGQERRYTQNGLDKVEFLISPNAGEPLKPLSKIASGGEMSRIMLAIKTILAGVDKIPTLIFDEIDIGISGKAAQKVGEKLSYLSGSHQVLCVTHLAQIACMADRHYLIEKFSTTDNTYTKVEKLDQKRKKAEIARMLAGVDISSITLRHAEEMLENAKKIKRA